MVFAEMTDSTLKLAGGLIKNGIRFHYQHLTGKPGKPAAVSLEIIHDCIARCVMCNIWRIPQETPNLSVEQWLSLLAEPLFNDLKELDITGGEPFLRKDLADLFFGISALKRDKLTQLKSIAITTNAIMTRRVLTQTERILAQLQKDNIDLVVVCAMDAIGALHDRIRGVKNAWRHVDKTIRGLTELRSRYPNLIIGLKTTVLPDNIAELDGIAHYAEMHGLFTIISPCIITPGRYLNPDSADKLAFSKADHDRMIGFYQNQASGWSYHGEQLAHYLRTGKIHKPCSCGFNYCFIRSNGELFLCPLIAEGVGNVTETPAETLFQSTKAARIRRRIGHFPQCQHCTEPGLERYSLPYEGFAYLGLLFRMGRQAFLQHHQHMGLDKYF